MCRSIITILLSAIVALANAAIPATDTLKAGVLTPVMAAPALKLQGSDGKPLDLERFRGKVVLLAFGFSNCGRGRDERTGGVCHRRSGT